MIDVRLLGYEQGPHDDEGLTSYGDEGLLFAFTLIVDEMAIGSS